MKTSSDPSKQIPTKTEDIIKTEETFLTKDMNQLSLQNGYLQDNEQQYNPFLESGN